jgi:lysozyme
MPPFIPNAKPKLELDVLISKFIPSEDLEILKQSPVSVVIIAEYYAKTADAKGYNDAVFLLYNKDGVLKMLPFNGSCNPSNISRDVLGKDGKVKKKGTPVLDKNIVYKAHVLDFHKGKYLALCQRVGDVSVTRLDHKGDPYTDVGRFGINLHRGGVKSLNSEGCMTIPPPPSQYSELIGFVKKILGEQSLDIEKRTIVPIVVYWNK